MNTQKIDGKSYARMLFGGAARLASRVQELNDLNVFPVADGDTGTNMLRTMEGGLAEFQEDSIQSIGECSKRFARGVLLSARGNSGVILSQIFAGINEELEAHDEVDAQTLAEAYRKGIVSSYAAVQNPTEGTILTVFRESTECAWGKVSAVSSVEDFFKLHIEAGYRSLASTKELLPALSEADVVDSGAAGYLCIAEGMYQVLCGEELRYDFFEKKEKSGVNIDAFTRDSDLTYGYCTEFLLRLMTVKVDPDLFDMEVLVSALKQMGGESIVSYKQDDLVKVHVHTFSPGAVLSKMQEFGEFLTVKVENMNLEHSDVSKPKKEVSKKFSVVAVATGDGMAALFTQMGADCIISGGQTSNPSTEEFVQAFKKCETSHIIVLPNNKNIILAARQAAELYKDATVHVIESKSMVQGYSALSVITPGITDIDSLLSSAERAAQEVTDGQITRAVRDATTQGIDIKNGDYIAISGGTIQAVAKSAEEAVLTMLENVDTDFSEIITLFVGQDVDEERRAELTEQLKEIYDECEIVVYEGGQPVYDYLVSVE